MAITKRTIVDQVEVTRSGHVQVRFGIILEDNGEEISCKWHRTAIEPGGDVDAAIAAVNDHLTGPAGLNAKAVEADRVGLVKAVCAVAHTPELVAKYRAMVRAAREDRAKLVNR